MIKDDSLCEFQWSNTRADCNKLIQWALSVLIIEKYHYKTFRYIYSLHRYDFVNLKLLISTSNNLFTIADM